MNQIEKKLKKHYQSLLKHEDRLLDIKKQVTFKERKPWYFVPKMAIPIYSSMVLAASLAVIIPVSLFNTPRDISDQAHIKKAVIEMDINPSILLTVDEDSKISAIVGKNDDGKLVVIDEDYVGMNYWEAIKKLIKSEIQTGYLLIDKKDLNINDFAFTVYSDSSSYRENLTSQLSSYLSKETLLNLDTNITVKESSDYRLLNQEYCLDFAINTKFDDVKKQFDDYQKFSKDCAIKAVEEFASFSTYYQKRVAYLETAINMLNVGGAYNNESLKCQALKTQISSYITLYSNLFINESSQYMNYYQNIMDDKVDILKQRYDLSRSSFSKEEILSGLLQAEQALQGCLDSLDNFRNYLFNTIKNRFDTLLNDYRGFETLINSDAFLNVVGKTEFQNDYMLRYSSYVKSFNDQYRGAFIKWKELITQYKKDIKNYIGL